MRVPDDHPLCLTWALLRPDTAPAAVEALRGRHDRVAVEGLAELLSRDPPARTAVAAIDLLRDCPDPVAGDALLLSALSSQHASVRSAALEALRLRGPTPVHAALVELLGGDDSWPVRRLALRALADTPGPGRWDILAAATDPHWRVRHALIQLLLDWGDTDAARREIADRLARAGDDPRVRGVRTYLHYRWSGVDPPAAALTAPPDPARECPFWDWDAAVLARKLERLGEAGRRQAIDAMPFLLGHADSRVRTTAAEALGRWGGPTHFTRVLALFYDPRGGGGRGRGDLASDVRPGPDGGIGPPRPAPAHALPGSARLGGGPGRGRLPR